MSSSCLGERGEREEEDISDRRDSMIKYSEMK